MNVADVREVVQAARVDPTYYSLDGERHEALCLMSRGQRWYVFLSERGERFEERAFESQDEACVYFLKRLFELWSPR
jgi:hypothetical protein